MFYVSIKRHSKEEYMNNIDNIIGLIVYYFIGEMLIYFLITKKHVGEEVTIFSYMGTFFAALAWPLTVPIILLYKLLIKITIKRK